MVHLGSSEGYILIHFQTASKRQEAETRRVGGLFGFRMVCAQGLLEDGRKGSEAILEIAGGIHLVVFFFEVS